MLSIFSAQSDVFGRGGQVGSLSEGAEHEPPRAGFQGSASFMEAVVETFDNRPFSGELTSAWGNHRRLHPQE
jgi:hypothetical protein